MTCPRSRNDYRGLHVAAAHIQAELLDWEPPVARVDRVRVRAHTCVCQSPIFELCTTGGLWFVRRITAESPVVIDESPQLSARDGENLWWRILHGKAR